MSARTHTCGETDKKLARLSTLAENERSFAAVSFPRCRISESDDSLASNKWRDYFEIEPTTPPDDFSFLRLSRARAKNGESIVTVPVAIDSPLVQLIYYYFMWDIHSPEARDRADRRSVDEVPRNGRWRESMR